VSSIAYTWGTTVAERALVFPGDRAEEADWTALFRGVTIAAPAPRAFRWLCQLRAAPYSYDWLDNRGRQSPRALTPGLDRLEVGQKVMEIFRLADFASGEHITLVTPPGGRGERLFGAMRCTYWTRAESASRTRLLVKLRIAPARSAASRVAKAALAWGDLIMMRRQLLNLKRLAERS
jgi:hypothetical protein